MECIDKKLVITCRGYYAGESDGIVLRVEMTMKDALINSTPAWKKELNEVRRIIYYYFKIKILYLRFRMVLQRERGKIMIEDGQERGGETRERKFSVECSTSEVR